MRWLKGDLRKSDLVIISVVFLAALLLVVSALLGWGHQTAPSGQATGTGTVQGTPTVDATAVAVDILKQQDEKLQRENSGFWPIWLAISGSIGGMGAVLAAAAAFIAASRGFKQWLGNRQDEQVKRAEERFQKVVEGLGSEREEAKVGAAIMLRTFLQQGYEQFHHQTFDLAVAHLRLPRTSDPEAHSSAPPPLSQALIVIFKEAFPLVRSQNTKDPQSLDATGIQLDDAYLREADLKQVWMPLASLQNAQLSKAKLNEADLRGANLSRADLRWTDLSKTDLFDTYLTDAILSRAVLHEAKLMRAYLHRTDLASADLSGADLTLATLKMVNLKDANLSGTNLEEADLSETNLVEVRSLEDANLCGVKGLTKEQLETCKARGAIIDEAPTTSPPQSPVSPPAPPQSKDTQAPSAPSAQVSTPTPATGGSSGATASQPDTGS